MEAIAVIAAIVGLVWGGLLFARGGLLAGCLTVLLAGTCFSVPFYKIELGPLPLTADRLLLVILLGQYVVWRRLGWADVKPLGKPEVLLLLFIAVLTISTLTSDWQAENYRPLSWLIIYYMMPAVIYWIARQTKLDRHTVLTLFVCLGMFGLYLAVTALAEYFKLWWMVFPKYIADTAASAQAEFVGRGRGPLLNPIAQGVMLTACFGAAMMCWPWLHRRGQFALAAVSLIYLAGFYSSMTRSVWMGAALAVVLAVGLALPWSWRAPLLIGSATVAVLAVAVHWQSLVAFKRDESLGAEKTAESVELRPILATIAWKMFLDRPVFGCGYGQYSREHKAYVSDRSTQLALERGRGYIQHNVVLSLLTETGVVGLGLLAAMVGFWTRDSWRLWRNATLPLWARQQGLLLLIALGGYFLNGMFHDVSVVPMANMTLFFLAGVTAGLRPLLNAAPAGSGEGLLPTA